MTREQTAKLLQSLIGAYPDTFIKDARATLDMWCLQFAEEDADKVYKATRLYIRKGKRFPAPADIVKLMNVAGIYDAPRAPELPSKAQAEDDMGDLTDAQTGCDICPYKDWADTPNGCHRERCVIE